MSLQASVAEMLLNGLELVLSAVAALVIRKRKISRSRWLGVLIVTVGLIVIGVADLLSDGEEGSSDVAGRVIGIVLCIAVAFVATLLAMVEELMTQEEGYAALIVMGNEGLWGTLFGLAMYYPVSPLFGESPSETWDTDSTWKTTYAAMLVCLFCTAGMANIYSISTTSSMTRNIWRHLSTIPVWATGLVVYYSDATQFFHLSRFWYHVWRCLHVLSRATVIQNGTMFRNLFCLRMCLLEPIVSLVVASEQEDKK